MISGLSHITLIVADLERASTFLKSCLDAEEIYASNGTTFSLAEEKFFLINDLWVCIMKGKPLSERSYNHIAFQIADEEFDRYLAKLQAANVDFAPARPRVEGEGRSIYFYDHDNHLFELHTGNLAERLARYHG